MVDSNSISSVKMKDVLTNLESKISENDLFDFDASQIDRMRTEIYDVLGHITDIYQNHCEALLAPSDTESDDDDEIIITGIRTNMGKKPSVDIDALSDSDAEISDWRPEYEDDDDSHFSCNSDDDDMLSADTRGKNEAAFVLKFAPNIFLLNTHIYFQPIYLNFIPARIEITTTLI